jgi:hypothetical protein
MGILVAGILRDSHHGQQFFDPFQLFRFAEALIDLDGLGDDVLDEPARVEGPVGILENDLDVFLEGVSAAPRSVLLNGARCGECKTESGKVVVCLPAVKASEISRIEITLP